MFDPLILIYGVAPFLLINFGFFLLGYRDGWRWLGLASLLYLPVAYVFSEMKLIPISLVDYTLITALSYFGGSLWYLHSHDDWPVSKAEIDIAENVVIDEDDKDPAIVWEIEYPFINRRNYKKILLWMIAMLLAITATFIPVDSDFLVVVRVILCFLIGMFVFGITIMTNRERKMYGLTRDYYGIAHMIPGFSEQPP